MLKKTVKYIIDILIILAVLAVGYYGYGKISAKYNTKLPSSEKKIYVKVEFEKHDKDVLEKIKVGDKIKDGSRNEEIGTVYEAEPVTDSEVIVSDYKNGKFVKTTTPEFGKRTVVLECEGKVSPVEVNVNGTDVKVGYTINIRTNEYALSGKVIGINIDGEDK